jgi:hypothetical protein
LNVFFYLTISQARGMEMWTAALKWAMEFDSIVNRHNLAVADEEYAKLKPPVADEPLTARSPAVASPITPRQFSLARDSLTIPLDDDVGLRSVSLHACCTCYVIVMFSSFSGASAATRRARPIARQSHASSIAGTSHLLTAVHLPPSYAVCSSAFSTSCASRTRMP